MTHEFADTSVFDLARATGFIHYIIPSLKGKIVCAIEKSKPFDMNVVFHLKDIKEDEAKDQTDNHSVLMLSAEYIIEHSYWKT